MTRAVGTSLALAVSLLAASCANGGTETGNPPFDAKLSYAAYTSKPEAVSIGGAGTAFDVKALWVTVPEPRFVVNGTCGAPARKTLAAPPLGTDNRAVPSPRSTTFAMSPGAFCAVDVSFATTASASLPQGAPTELGGHALMIDGTLANGTRVSILDDASTLELVPASGDFSMEASDPDVVIAFDVATWFSGFDLSGATADPDGTIRLGNGVNAGLLATFEARVKSGVALFRDEDGDGLVDPGATPIATAR